MALALIIDVRDGPAGPVVRVDTGTNPYVVWRVGTDRGLGEDGDELLGVSYESPLQRRTGVGAFQTAFDLALEAERFDRTHRYVQVVSFKDPSRRSPAWSPIRQVLLPSSAPDAWVMSSPRWASGGGPAGSALLPARSVAFCAEERQLSGALFWGDLLGMVDSLAPLGRTLLDLVKDEKVQAGAAELVKLLGPVLQGLVDSAAAPTAAAPAPAAAPVPAPAPLVTAHPAGAPAPPAAPAAAVQQSRPRRRPPGRQVARPPGLAARHPDAAVAGRPLTAGMDFGVISGPALLGLLTALGPSALQALTPLLQKAPEILRAFLDSPVKLFTAVADANRADAALTDQQVQGMLRHGDQHLLLDLLRAVGGGQQPVLASPPVPVSAPQSIRMRSLARSAPRVRPTRARASTAAPGRRVDPRIDVALLPPPPLPGRTDGRSLYAAGGPIVLQARLGTGAEAPDRPIPHVVAHVRIRTAAGAEVLLDRHLELPAVWPNQQFDVALDAAATAALPRGVDLLAALDVTWTGRDGAAYTTASRATQQLCVVGDHVVLGLDGAAGAELPLRDPSRYRPFWHQIWEGGAAGRRRWRLEVSARYYYRLTGAAASNGRMDTRIRSAPEDSGKAGTTNAVRGYLKSGMELAVGELNKLLPEAGLEPWSADELAALGSDEVVRLTSRQATTDLELRGQDDERGSAWTFPVLQPVTVDLHRVTHVLPTGAVGSLEAGPKPFLLPVAAVFVGMTTED